MRRDRKRFLNNLEVDSSKKTVLNVIVNSVGERRLKNQVEEDEESDSEEELVVEEYGDDD